MASDHTKEVSKLIKFKLKTRVLKRGRKLRAILKMGRKLRAKSVDNLKLSVDNLCITCIYLVNSLLISMYNLWITLNLNFKIILKLYLKTQQTLNINIYFKFVKTLDIFGGFAKMGVGSARNKPSLNFKDKFGDKYARQNQM